jgi:sugar phosphate isomerase/epimerase
MFPCISQATTMSTPFADDLPAFARAGFAGVELWLTKLETFLESHSTREAANLLADLGLHAAAAAGQGGVLLATGEERRATWDHFRRRLDLLAELRVPTLVVAADPAPGAILGDYPRAAESLAEAAELANHVGVRIALEFRKGSGICACLETATALVVESGAANAGVCLDLFHYYTGPSKFEDLGLLTGDMLAWVQLCDLSGTPREVAGDADRILPGDGDFRVGPVLDHLAGIGYDGGVSLELLNPSLWSVPPGFVADLGYQAMARVLGRAATVPDGDA